MKNASVDGTAFSCILQLMSFLPPFSCFLLLQLIGVPDSQTALKCSRYFQSQIWNMPKRLEICVNICSRQEIGMDMNWKSVVCMVHHLWPNHKLNHKPNQTEMLVHKPCRPIERDCGPFQKAQKTAESSKNCWVAGINLLPTTQLHKKTLFLKKKAAELQAGPGFGTIGFFRMLISQIGYPNSDWQWRWN